LGIAAYLTLSRYFKDNISDLEILFIELIWAVVCLIVENAGKKYYVTFSPLSCDLSLNDYMCTASEGSPNVVSFTCELEDKQISRPFYRIGLSLSPGSEVLHIPLLAELHTESGVSKMSFQMTKIEMVFWDSPAFHNRRFCRSKTKGVHNQPLQNGEKVLMCFALDYNFHQKRSVENGRFLICLKVKCTGSICWTHSMIEVQSCDKGCEVLSQYHTRSGLKFQIKYFFKKMRLRKKPECAMFTYLCKL